MDGYIGRKQISQRRFEVLENISAVFDMVPSIIDYAVSVGLKETSAQWIVYLEKNGNLISDVPLKTIFDRN